MKTIYQPKGKAAEYAKWACNLYNGCSNLCEYCYNRHGLAMKVLGKDVPTLKSGFTEETAFDTFKKELIKSREKIGDDWVHFNFVSDPCLEETYRLNLRCIKFAMENGVRVQVLTKMHDWIAKPEWKELIASSFFDERRSLIKFGFTLTGCDGFEPNASTNIQRIGAMRILNDLGYQTWASIEPVIDLERSLIMIQDSLSYCDEYRIGLLSGKKSYTKEQVRTFKSEVDALLKNKAVIWKDSVLKFVD